MYEIQHNGSRAVSLIKRFASEFDSMTIERKYVGRDGIYGWEYRAIRKKCDGVSQGSHKIFSNQYRGGRVSKIQKSVEDRVKSYRMEGLSQQKIADATGLSRKQVRRILAL